MDSWDALDVVEEWAERVGEGRSEYIEDDCEYVDLVEDKGGASDLS